MSHVFRFELSDRPGDEFTLIDTESNNTTEAREVLEWQFRGRVLDVRDAIDSNATGATEQ